MELLIVLEGTVMHIASFCSFNLNQLRSLSCLQTGHLAQGPIRKALCVFAFTFILHQLQKTLFG